MGGNDSRTTVLNVIDRLNVGGAALQVALATKHLDPARFRSVLVTGTVELGEADMGYLIDQYGIDCVVIPSLGRELRPFRDLLTAWRLYRVMRRERPDIVHTHKSKAGAIGRVVALLAGVPVRVHTFHGHVFQGYFSPAKTRLFLQIERTLARVSSRLIALTEGLADELSDRYELAPRDCFAVLPLGLDLGPFGSADRSRGQLRERLGLGDATLVGIVGRMVAVKDHATFVAAAAELARRRADIHFIFVGGGELETEVRFDLERRGLAGRAHLLGWCRDLPAIYADLDVVALSSINEGIPVALIEAMSAGVPVASTSVGGVPDLLKHGRRGELAPSRDPSALASAIERALAPAARARATAIRDEILEEFGVVRLCRDLETLYAELCGGRIDSSEVTDIIPSLSER